MGTADAVDAVIATEQAIAAKAVTPTPARLAARAFTHTVIRNSLLRNHSCGCGPANCIGCPVLRVALLRKY
ncbi:hypothetical protein GCM10027167_81080 [Nocardia heshunensis]